MTLSELLDLVAPAAALGCLLLVPVTLALGLALRKRRTLEERLGRLERTLTVYAETATSVAQTLDQVLLDRVQPGQQVHSSRRYLLAQARERLSRGEPLGAVRRGLGLSHDEARLLSRLGSTEATRQILVPEAEVPSAA